MARDAIAGGSSSTKSLVRQLLVLAAATTLAVGGATAYTFWRLELPEAGEKVQTTEVPQLPEVKTVTALGRLEPSGEIVRVSVPSSAQGSRVDRLLVREGDWVAAGEVIAILDSRDRLLAAVEEAKTQVGLARARLEQVRAGAKVGDIRAREAKVQQMNAELEGQISTGQATIASLEAQLQGETLAQEATIERIAAELENARTDCQRYEMLYAEGAVSDRDRSSICLQATTARERLEEARANLNRIATTGQEQIKEAKANLSRAIATIQQQTEEARGNLEAVAQVRPEDLRVAQKELEATLAAVTRAEADLALAYVLAPIEGRVLVVNTLAGESIAPEGIVEMAQTSQMYAIAEVYETDIGKVRSGQEVRVKSDSIVGELQGTVEQIGFQVLRQNVINADPSANIDARVIEVKVRLDEASSERVAGLTNLQVKVTISL